MKSSFHYLLSNEIAIMKIRIIDFSEEKCPADLKPYWHQVNLTSTGQDLGMIRFNQNIADMISQAIMSEWRQALGLVENQPSILALAEKYPKFKQWLACIADSGPSVVVQEQDDLFSDLDIDDLHDKSNDRLFINPAVTIVTRKTVFLLPDRSPSGSVLHQKENCDKFIASLSAFIDAGNSNIAMARAGDKPKGNAKDNDSIFRTVLESMFARKSQLRMDEDTGIHRKPGPLLIEGDTGTGKSAAAKHLAAKMGKKMYEINLAAISETLLETRMRGSKKGAYTGAIEDTDGFFKEAHNSVLFLDELQSASLDSQTQLLDLLSAISNDVWISRVGDKAEKEKYDVKVVLAVNEPVSRLLAEGRLRRDLFHRIRDVVKFKSLNDLFKQDNASALLTHILTLYRWKSFELPIFAVDGKAKQVLPQLFTVYEEGVIEKILRAPWPGNFRQLERFAWDLFFVLGENTIVTNDLIERLLKEEANRIPSSFTEPAPTHNVHIFPTLSCIVEGIIKKHKFNLKASLTELKEYRISYPQTLNKFICEHKAQFSESFLADSKISKIISSTTSVRKTG